VPTQPTTPTTGTNSGDAYASDPLHGRGKARPNPRTLKREYAFIFQSPILHCARTPTISEPSSLNGEMAEPPLPALNLAAGLWMVESSS
jgi:hypothetical protein